MQKSLLQHNVIGVTGRFGSGKSLYAVQLALKFAESARKHLVFNTPVNERKLRHVARALGYGWVATCARVSYVELSGQPDNLWKYRGCVFLYDEAGVFTNSRSWNKTSEQFLRNLFQVRKLDFHLIIVFQFESQIDKQIRQIIQHWVVCKSSAYYSLELNAPRIYSRLCLHYDAEKFYRLQEDTRARGNIILPFLWAKHTYFSFLPLGSLVAFLKNTVSELIDASVFLFSKGKKRLRFRYRKSLEQYLFSIFSSTSVVGEASAKLKGINVSNFVGSNPSVFPYPFEKEQN
jgi:hypothetical protein